MSYDIWLEVDTGGPEPCRIADGWNCTSNISGMWRAAGADLADFDGQTAHDCIESLTNAIAELRRDPDKYRAMDSPNGWGKYEHLVPTLDRLLDDFRRHPKATVRVWR